MHAFDGRTDGRTDGQTDRNPTAIPRLHSMQRGKNGNMSNGNIRHVEATFDMLLRHVAGVDWALEMGSRRIAIQILVYLTLPPPRSTSTPRLSAAGKDNTQGTQSSPMLSTVQCPVVSFVTKCRSLASFEYQSYRQTV